MKHYIIISSLAIIAVMSGCGKTREQQIAEIKSSLSAGDKILYENADDMILSLGNDSLIVRCNVTSDESDTIFRTTPTDRIGVYTTPGYIALVRKEGADTIGVYSYGITSREIVSNKACGIGYIPYFDSDCISIVSVQKENNAVYEASLTIGLDGSANGDISLGKEICKVAVASSNSKRSSNNPWSRESLMSSIFDDGSSNGTVYWWECADCHKTVKSSGKPPYRGCMRWGDPDSSHNWRRGNRAE